ncbi:gamma-glutamylcyclotransferase [Kitasatospora sp. NBC_01287]|uniref:allophanate hydrolase-related protein n=1 Tax=Kitasatospora sp. NBC_01287 TaxID=2903573 RepID=UPI00224F614C|nr:gamma-glutamylcyclotransferase [Kitasatospora sp. NBC_01287]MCX4745300.1 gamma-glutamylcyclotransferase [Kitasatospora sp. NBC_01287]
MVRMFLNGQAMRGGEFHPLLGDSPFLGVVRTAPGHRFFSIRDVCPGLLPDPKADTAIEGELYEVTLEFLRDVLLPGEPPELEFGVIELADGSACFSMVLARGELERGAHREITGFGGWRAYLATLGRAF